MPCVLPCLACRSHSSCVCQSVCVCVLVPCVWPGSFVSFRGNTHAIRTHLTIVTSKAVNYHKQHTTNFCFALLWFALFCFALQCICWAYVCMWFDVLSYLFLCDAHKYIRHGLVSFSIFCLRFFSTLFQRFFISFLLLGPLIFRMIFGWQILQLPCGLNACLLTCLLAWLFV